MKIWYGNLYDGKNRDRDKFSFANINLLGPCNCDCYFCLGKDLPNYAELRCRTKELLSHFTTWPRFDEFIARCKAYKIRKLYVTGQTTDSLLYEYLSELIDYLHGESFGVGLRTNGFIATTRFDVINKCDLNVGYTINTLDPTLQRMICGSAAVPEWDKILRSTKNCRVQIVVTRVNRYDVFNTLRFLSDIKHMAYIQMRRVSTETRSDLLAPDVIAYEDLYANVKSIFPLKYTIYGDAEVYDIFGQDVVFWRTTKTTVNSINYFTDGTLSDEYFIVEGYLKNKV